MATEYNTEMLDSIDKLTRELQEEIVDYEWDGNFDMADLLRNELDHLYMLRDRGDKYIPRF